MDRNYEQEYKKAFEAAKGLHEAGNALTKKQMEIVFPQLAESDDERIRLELIEFIQWAEDRGMTRHDFHQAKRPSEWLAYLEKQKEHQNKSDAHENALGRDLTFPQDKDNDLDEIAQDYVDGVKEYNYEPTWDLMQTAVCYGYHYCEQKEQKPAQTDDEKEYIRTVKGIIADFIRDKKPEDVGYYQRIYDWLDGRHIEQKPAEIDEYKIIKKHITEDSLSSEVNKRLKECGWYVTDAESTELPTMNGDADLYFDEWNQQQSNPTKRQCFEEGIKYAQRLQKEQKPAEWSEEDEAMRDNILRVLSCYVGPVECESNPYLSSSYFTYRREIDWLKSLRPSWKPSEEQMKALLGAEGISRASGHPDNAKVLSSLYEQLKRLRG